MTDKPLSFDPREIGFTLETDEETLRELEEIREQQFMAYQHTKHLVWR